MRSLPRKALIYWALVCLLGLTVATWAWLWRGHWAGGQLWETFLFVALAAAAGGRKIRLLRNVVEEDVGSLPLLFPIAFAALLHYGPAVGVVVVAVGSLSAGLFPKRQSWHALLFSIALAVVQAWFAGLLFLRLNQGRLELDDVHSFSAIAAACLAYYAIHTGGTARLMALGSGQKTLSLWRRTFLWTAPGFFVGSCISSIALLVFRNNVGGDILIVSPVAYLIYHSYAIYMMRAEEKQKHIEELQLSQAHLAGLYLATIKSLALAIDAKDQYTHQHILRVQRYAVVTAMHMGLEGVDLEGLNTGALLHDIGKLGVPEYVLLKPGRLTDDEFAKIKKHPEIGAAILDPVEFPWPVLPVVKSHHEKWDGTGYPEGLAGEDIPLTARILSVADVYDALTSNRSYRHAWTHEKAIDAIIQDSETHFDPQVVHAFLQVIDGVVLAMALEGCEGDALPADAPEGAASPSHQAARAIQRASSELWALYEVAQTLSSSLGLGETLEILSRKLEAILPGTACLFLLRQEGSATLHVRTAVGVNREFFLGAQTLGASSPSWIVTQTRETYQGDFDADDLLPNSSPGYQWTPLNSALVVPIVHQGEVLGTINLYHPQTEAFGPHDRQLLETIAERSAMALFNGLLFDRTRSHALTDPLTGLYNVRHLTQYVEDRCRTEVVAPFALLCLDLDSFKPINDNFGHLKGDQVLRDLSDIFRSSVRERDVVARYGGDEFLIVLQDAGFDEASAMAARLQDAVLGYDPGLCHPRLGSLRLGVSIGFGCFPEDGRDCASLMSAADTLMYHNKTERKLGNLAGHERPDEAERGGDRGALIELDTERNIKMDVEELPRAA
ncbi:MAG: diguanylate cyclase [Armatimonadota bacterium]|nr:diguanylate cyclase [Armatimonadota bacterium]